MGCSWWSFATKSSNYNNLVAIDNEPATLLIPEFAISWANNQSQLAIKHAGDYADFYMQNGYNNCNQINGHLLIAIFKQLYIKSNLEFELDDLQTHYPEEQEAIELLQQEREEIINALPTFEECFYRNDSFPFENQTLEKLRHQGIDLDFGAPFDDLLIYGIKVIPGHSTNQTYKNVQAVSYCGQF